LPAKGGPDDPEIRKPKPVQIKVGISDGMMTEVTEGLEEGQQIITGVITTDSMASRPTGPAANPFGGGGGFRRF
jgi:HlyD family secretion protein